MDYVIRRCAVGGDGNIIHHGNTKQRLYVGVVGLGFQRIPEENDDVYFPFRYLRADLLIAAEPAAAIWEEKVSRS